MVYDIPHKHKNLRIVYSVAQTTWYLVHGRWYMIHEHEDLTSWFPGPLLGGAVMSCRILLFMLPLGARDLQLAQTPLGQIQQVGPWDY